MWFEKLMGFSEESPEQVRENLILDGENITSKINGKNYKCGTLSVSSLAELKQSVSLSEFYKSKISVSEIVGNVQNLHCDSANKGAMFQAASQFNLLEMTSPNVIPERGVGIYENDHTQGPACAIACGAGTIYRNYFVKLGMQRGQTFDSQIDCLADIGKHLGNEKSKLWKMQNGYALANEEGLKYISDYINNLNSYEYENLKDKLRIGIQWNSEVTISSNKQNVSQAYCSALPVAYSQVNTKYWEKFARLILEATYEATFYAALKNYKNTNNNKLYLTLVGGGVFGNEMKWILDAIKKSIIKFRNTPLNVKIVSYGSSKYQIRDFVNSF